MPQKVTNATIAAKPTHARNVGDVVRIRTSNPKHEKTTKTDTAPTTSQNLPSRPPKAGRIDWLWTARFLRPMAAFTSTGVPIPRTGAAPYG